MKKTATYTNRGDLVISYTFTHKEQLDRIKEVLHVLLGRGSTVLNKAALKKMGMFGKSSINLKARAIWEEVHEEVALTIKDDNIVPDQLESLCVDEFEGAAGDSDIYAKLYTAVVDAEDKIHADEEKERIKIAEAAVDPKTIEAMEHLRKLGYLVLAHHQS
jgi:uncharacterized membrane-anchored protein YjiN (DUF445 family)